MLATAASCGGGESGNATGIGGPNTPRTGTLAVTVSGLPSGTPASVTISSATGYTRAVAATETIALLAPGAYDITASEVSAGQDKFGASPSSQSVTVTLGATTPVTVGYAILTGSLSIGASGLPAGATPQVTVAGPNGFERTVSAGATLGGLLPGTYRVTPASIVVDNSTYAPGAPSLDVSVSPSSTPVVVAVPYQLASGALVVAVSGLPDGTNGSAIVTGPGGFQRTVSPGEMLENLASGRYTISGVPVTVGVDGYRVPAPVAIDLTPSTTPISATLTYALATGRLSVSINGLPAGASAAVTVTGSGNYVRTLTSTQTLAGVAPGAYTVAAASVVAGGITYAPTPVSRLVSVVASATPAAASVSYTASSGNMLVTVTGLPQGVPASIAVTGPSAYAAQVTSTVTLTNLKPGSYTLSASNVTSGTQTYAPTPTTRSVTVNAGASTTSASVAYALSGSPPPPPPPSGLNLTIDGMHIQQVVQTYGGSVPLVAGRAGLLRVFVKANTTNTATPGVRVRFYNGATLTNTITITAPTASTPQAITEGTLTSSWNYAIPANVMQPGLKILADVDPTNAVTESSDSDNSYPSNGTPATIDVRSVPTFNVRLVPVLQSANALQGGVTAGNANSYLAQTRALYPINTIDADVRAPFTTSAPPLQSSDGNGAWGQILSEISALRAADGSARYYYGVVKVGYSSGIAGLGYVPGRAAIGWDYLPSASGVMAHEVGHNFGRFHAPGCGAGGPDPSYPKVSGRTEAFGYDIATNALKDTSANFDLMGYCNPDWISAYTYTAVLAYHSANPFSAAAAINGGYARHGLLVWGRVQHGQVILEPAYEVDAPPSLPQRPGRNRVQGFGALGEVLFDFSFDGERVADHPDVSSEHFAFVVPYGMMGGVPPTRVRVATANRQAEFTSTASAPSAASEPTVERVNARTVRVRWNDAATRGVLVRHPTTGEILAFARGGDALVYTGASTLDLVRSDGVRSTRQRARVAPEGRSPQR